MSRSSRAWLCVFLTATVFSSLSYAASPDRIPGTIDPTNVVEIPGHISLLAQPQYDQGPVESSRTMHVTMLFMPSGQQQQALDKLLADQQDEKSPNYHKWLTVAQYADRFGMSPGDLQKVKAWLQADGFKITYVANGRDFISFEGNAGQVQTAFRTQIHSYHVNGKTHFANMTPPMIPAALSGIVGGFRGLHDFFPHSMAKQHPSYSVSNGGGFFTVLAPGDIGKIYDINPLYQAGIDGTGQTIAIAGQSDVYLADINFFRGAFGLTQLSGCTVSAGGVIQAGTCTGGNFQMVVPNDGFGDPGIQSGDLTESDLDIETVSGVARGAKILFVTSSGGVDDSAGWVIDQNLAKVISYSYGLCEPLVTSPSISTLEVEYQKAAGLGISFFAASGDGAAATCDAQIGTAYPNDIYGQTVSYPASSAWVTGVGGTEFDDINGTYWSPIQTDQYGTSALGPIPETGWNDTALTSNPAALDGSGGGPSNCESGTGFTTVGGFQYRICDAPPNGGIPKPSYQIGITPSASVRDVPDIAFSGSNFNDPYIVCLPQSELGGTVTTSTCSPGGTAGINTALTTYNSAFGGTSASTPVAAAMTALLNQYLNANGVGLFNTQLYKLFSSSATEFNIIASGTNSTTGGSSSNVVSCTAGQPSFEPPLLQCPSTGQIGYTVGGTRAYNQVTGLGSLDVNAFFQAWSASRTSTSTTISPSATNINLGQSVTFTATVTPSSATGTVSFFDNGSTTALGSGTLSNGTATFTTTTLPAGTNSVTASYGGDGSNGNSSSAPAVVTVTAPFSMSATPSSASLNAGNSTSSTVTVTPQPGYTTSVTLTCTAPTGVSCAFSYQSQTNVYPITVPMNGSTPDAVALTISTLPNMATGAQQVTVTATSGTTTETSNIALTVGATTESYTITAPNASYPVTPGQTATVTVTIASTNGFVTGPSGSQTTVVPLTFTCSENASESTCTGPTTATNATSVTFTIKTTAPTTASRRRADPGSRIFYASLLPGLLGIVLTFSSRRRSQGAVRMLGLIMVLGFSTLWLGSCGGSSNSSQSNPGTSAGSYNITISATTGGANPVTSTISPVPQLVVQ